MGIRVGQGGVVGKGDENAVLIRRRELRVPSSVVTLFSMASSKNRSRNQACKRKKKDSSRDDLLSFSCIFFTFFPKKKSRKCPRESMWSMLRGTWNFHQRNGTLSSSLSRSIIAKSFPFGLLFSLFRFISKKINGNENGNEQKEKRETITGSKYYFDREKSFLSFFHTLIFTLFELLIAIYKYETKRTYYVSLSILLLQSSRKVSPTDLVC